VAPCLALLGVLLIPWGADSTRFTDRSALWQRSERDVLWGFRNMYNPHVVHEPGAQYPFRMWFFGWASEDCNPGYSGCDAIYTARGKTLDEWEVYAGDRGWDAEMRPETWVPVVTAQDRPWDQWHNGDPSVVLHEGTYYLAYSSTGFDLDGVMYGQPGDTDGDLCCIMGATSQDGIHWTKSQRPILVYEPEIGRPGYRPEQDDAVLGGMYHRPSLMRDGGKWRLWFDYWQDTEHGVCMGLAENEGDFLNPADWHIVRAGDSPALANWVNPDVVKVGERYYSYADPYVYGNHPWTGRQIAEAVSDNGLSWRELGFIRPDSDSPANHVPEALVVGNQIVLFYACQNGGDPYDYRYSRIRYMTRPIGEGE
jgi:hypothetical protein